MNTPVLRTASGKEAALEAFRHALKRNEGMTFGDLAAHANVGRTHLSQVLTGKRSGRQTWKHVISLIGNETLFHLKQCSAWNSHAGRAATALTSLRELSS